MVTSVRRWAFAPLALAGCASPQGVGGDGELDRLLASLTAGEPRRCVSAASGQGLTIIAPGAIGYRAGDTLWVSRPGPACSGMRPTDILIVEARGGRHCRGDPVRALPTGSSVAGPTCSLGDFTPYRRSG